MSELIQKALTSKPQEVLGTTNKTYRFIVSTDGEDRDGDIIDQKGWDLSDFNQNPVALLQHKQEQPVGKWSNFHTRAKSNGKVGFESVADLTLAPPVSDLLKYANALVEAGILNATSVGFRVGSKDFEFRKDAQGRKTRGKFIKKAKLHEISLVSVPANQEAIRVVKSMGMSEDYTKQFFSEAVESVDEAAEQDLLQSQLQTASEILKGHKSGNSAYKSVFHTQSLSGKIDGIIDPQMKALLAKSAALIAK